MTLPLLLTLPLLAGPAIDAPGSARIGQELTVKVSGFPAASVAVELCGNQARRGTADCAVSSSATMFVPEGRPATVVLKVVRPPIGCPCVIAARPVSGGTATTVPIKIKGVPTVKAVAAPAVPARNLTATKVSVRGGPSWFGASTGRTLAVTLRNQGSVPITDPPLSLAVGRGAEPTGVVPAPPLGTLAPGAERTYEIPFTLDGPVFGRYTVRGEITGLDRPIAFTASTSGYPWALPLLGVLLIPLPLLRRPRHRRRAGAAVTTPLTMNQIVASNLAHWRRSRDLPAPALALALRDATGRGWTARQITDIEAAWPVTEPHRFDANELVALSRALGVSLTDLFLPPTPDRPPATPSSADPSSAGPSSAGPSPADRDPASPRSENGAAI
ncbi:hypothetical protein [Spirillospora sp. NPDC047279]|uniref:hypothetical protein n=1 Tax=Spirillospora sp. NPDC047279 TaxID=3155478 RepID=UPI0033F8DE4D